MKKIKDKTKLMLKTEENKGIEIEELLRRLFVDEGKSTECIAEELSISYVTAFKWLQLAGIYSRKIQL